MKFNIYYVNAKNESENSAADVFLLRWCSSLNAVHYLDRRWWSRSLDHSHLTIDIMAFDTTESLDHTSTPLYVYASTCLIIFCDKCKLFGAAETAAEWETTLLGVSVSFRMSVDA